MQFFFSIKESDVKLYFLDDTVNGKKLFNCQKAQFTDSRSLIWSSYSIAHWPICYSHSAIICFLCVCTKRIRITYGSDQNWEQKKVHWHPWWMYRGNQDEIRSAGPLTTPPQLSVVFPVVYTSTKLLDLPLELLNWQPVSIELLHISCHSSGELKKNIHFKWQCFSTCTKWLYSAYFYFRKKRQNNWTAMSTTNQNNVEKITGSRENVFD